MVKIKQFLNGNLIKILLAVIGALISINIAQTGYATHNIDQRFTRLEQSIDCLTAIQARQAAFDVRIGANKEAISKMEGKLP